MYKATTPSPSVNPVTMEKVESIYIVQFMQCLGIDPDIAVNEKLKFPSKCSVVTTESKCFQILRG